MTMRTPTPGRGPATAPPVISSDQLADWIARRQRTRRRLTVIVLAALSLGVAALAVYWTAFSRHLIAKGQLEGNGFVVDWDIKWENLRTGGETSVSFLGQRRWYADPLRADALDPIRSLNHVKSFDASGLTWMKDDDLAVVAALGDLEDLELARPATAPEGMLGSALVPLSDRVLDHVQGLSNLKTLGLSNNRITDAGLAKLANLRRLELLDLDGTRVTDAGLDALVGIKSLKTLRLADTKVTLAGLVRFGQRRPDVEVIRQSYEDEYGTPTP